MRGFPLAWLSIWLSGPTRASAVAVGLLRDELHQPRVLLLMDSSSRTGANARGRRCTKPWRC